MIGKEEIKESLLAGNMILYIENLKESTKKFPIINEGVQQGCKIQDQNPKFIEFLYINNEQVKTKIKNTTIYNCSKEFEILRFKPSKICTGSVCCKL